MKSKDFLIEDNKIKQAIKNDDISVKDASMLSLIKRDCQPFLQAVDYKPILGHPLYRGIVVPFDADPFISKKVRLTNRKPRNTHIELHAEINDYFTEAFGAPFRDAIFCSGRWADASYYGRPYYIFPRGNFQYLWSPKVPDLYEKLEVDIRQHPGKTIEYIKKLEYQTTELQRGIDSNNEIMIRCDSYYGINERHIRNTLSGVTARKWEELLK